MKRRSRSEKMADTGGSAGVLAGVAPVPLAAADATEASAASAHADMDSLGATGTSGILWDSPDAGSGRGPEAARWTSASLTANPRQPY
jgi:hypothetical protein